MPGPPTLTIRFHHRGLLARARRCLFGGSGSGPAWDAAFFREPPEGQLGPVQILPPHPVEVRLNDDFLRAFRDTPLTVELRPEITEPLKAGLFRTPRSGEVFGQHMGARQPKLLVFAGESRTLPAVADVPWEWLTLSRPGASDRAVGLDPDVAVVRTLATGTPVRGAGRAEDEPIRIAAVLCNAPPDFSEHAQAFRDAYDSFAGEWRHVVESIRVGDPQHPPDFRRVADQIIPFNPEILIFMGHGRVHGRTTELRFGAWHPVAEVRAELIDRCPRLRLAVLLSCNTGHGDPEPTKELSRLGVEELLRAGLAGVVAMQARLPSATAVMFLKRFLARALDGHALPTTFTFARQTCADPTSLVWSVPVLFTPPEPANIDLGLGSRRLRVRTRLRELALAFPACPDYVQRGAEADLVSVLRSRRGIAVLQGQRGSGSTAFVGHAARGLLDPEPETTAVAANVGGFPRPLLYLDAEQLTGPMIADLVEDFSARCLPLLDVFLPSGELAPNHTGQSLQNEDALLAWLHATGAALVIDHADRLGPPLWAFIRLARARLNRGLVLPVVSGTVPTGIATLPGPPGTAVPPPVPSGAAPDGIQVVSLGRFSRDECVAFAQRFGKEKAVGADWFDQTGGEVHLLSWLAHRPQTTDGGMGAVGSPEALVAEINAVAPDAVAVAVICSCIPAGVRVEWLSSLAPEATQLNEALRLGLLLVHERDLHRFVSVPRLYREPLARRAASWGDTPRPLDAAAGRALAYIRRMLPVGEVTPTVLTEAQRRPGVVELLTDVAALMPDTSLDPRVRGACVWWVCQLNRALGRHAANRALLDRHLARVPLSRWQAPDLLLYGSTAQALGLTDLHSEILDTIVRAGLEPTADSPDVRIAYLLQKANHLKDAAAHERLTEIRNLYSEAKGLAEATGAEDLVATAVLNRAVVERYWAGDLTAAEAGFADAARRFRAAGEVVLAARAEVEEIGSAVGISGRDLRSHLPRLDKLLELLKQAGVADAHAFACFQKARVLREVDPAAPAVVAAAYALAAEAARRAGTPVIQAAGLRHQAEWQKKVGESDEKVRDRLVTAAALIADREGNAWARRVRRDALTELARLETAAAARAARWREAIRAALAPPLRTRESGSDRRRLAELLGEALPHLPLHDAENTDTLNAAGFDYQPNLPLDAQLRRFSQPPTE